MCTNKTFFKNQKVNKFLAVGHSLTTTDLMYGVRYERGLQWYSVYTDDGESWDLSGPPFHCSSALYSIKFWRGNKA